MTNKAKLVFTGGIALAVAAHVVKSQGKTEKVREAAKIALPVGIVISSIVLLANID